MNDQKKSGQPSWEMWVEHLISLPEKEQLQELLLKTKDQHLQIQKDLSEISELQSLVQELRLQIQKQGEQLVKQNESDQHLKALNKKREELKNDMEWVARQMEINKLDRRVIDSDRANMDLVIKEKADRVIKKYKKKTKRTVVAVFVIEIVVTILVWILYIGF